MIESTPTVRLRRSALETIRAHARATPARECCGALLGRGEAAGHRIDRVEPLVNGASRPDAAFLIDAVAVRRVERHARAAGADVVGFYHSHPDAPAIPSSADLEAAWPWLTYLIVGSAGRQITAWRLRGDRTAFEPQDLEWLA